MEFPYWKSPFPINSYSFIVVFIPFRNQQPQYRYDSKQLITNKYIKMNEQSKLNENVRQ